MCTLSRSLFLSVAFLCLSCFLYGGNTTAKGVQSPPEFITDIVGSANITAVQTQKGEVEVLLKASESQYERIKIHIYNNVQSAKEGYAKMAAIPAAAPFISSLPFGEEGMAWKSKGVGGTVVFRRDVAVVSISGNTDFERIMGISGKSDKRLKDGIGSVSKQIEALCVANQMKSAAVVKPVLDEAAKAQKAAAMIARLGGSIPPEDRSKLLAQLGALGA